MCRQILTTFRIRLHENPFSGPQAATGGQTAQTELLPGAQQVSVSWCGSHRFLPLAHKSNAAIVMETNRRHVKCADGAERRAIVLVACRAAAHESSMRGYRSSLRRTAGASRNAPRYCYVPDTRWT